MVQVCSYGQSTPCSLSDPIETKFFDPIKLKNPFFSAFFFSILSYRSCLGSYLGITFLVLNTLLKQSPVIFYFYISIYLTYSHIPSLFYFPMRKERKTYFGSSTKMEVIVIMI